MSKRGFEPEKGALKRRLKRHQPIIQSPCSIPLASAISKPNPEEKKKKKTTTVYMPQIANRTHIHDATQHGLYLYAKYQIPQQHRIYRHV
ncbi:unnamed protein product [Alternaria burnsii]|nr:unnamed protein product [Alternaria burnsii]